MYKPDDKVIVHTDAGDVPGVVVAVDYKRLGTPKVKVKTDSGERWVKIDQVRPETADE
jgi:hypothetical protein